jgi:predicted acyl esterase
LEDVAPDGSARGVSEGELRTLHATRLADGRAAASFERRDAIRLQPMQRVTHHIELLPLAMRFALGHRLRLVLGAADVDHFSAPAGSGPATWSIELASSQLRLPVAAG